MWTNTKRSPHSTSSSVPRTSVLTGSSYSTSRMQRKRRNTKGSSLLSASLLVNYILLLAMAIYTVAAVTKHYADYPQPTVLDSSHSHRTVPAPARKEVADAGGIQRPHNADSRKDGVPQEIKNAAAHAANKVWEGRKDLIQAQGVSKELFLKTAYLDLLAMSFREAGHDCSRIGDNGKSRGCFQIQTKLHGVTVEQAENPAWAAEWSLDRMVRNYDYPRNRMLSVRRHNGAGPGAVAYAEAVKQTAAKYEKEGI